MLNDFFGTFSSNGSGDGQLYSAFTVAGGLAAGAIAWVQV